MSVSDHANATDSQGFERWANLFTSHQAFSHPSELHGALCGRLAAGTRMDTNEWLGVVSEHMGLPRSALDEPGELAGFMAEAYDGTLALLKASDMSFQPLLPDDDYTMEQRLEALIAWIRGFLEGMALVAGESLGSAPEEIRELIEDLVAISQVSAGEDADEDSEQQLMEITEYVRLGALAVFTEFNPPETPAAGPQTLH